MGTDKQGNWVLFSYNGNETVARLIVDATFTQLSLFIDSGGNQDDDPEWLFENWNDVSFVQIPHDTIGLGNSTNLVYWNDNTVRICDLQQWVVEYTEYPEGKIVRSAHSDTDLSEAVDSVAQSDSVGELKESVEEFMNNGGLSATIDGKKAF